jgi:uncharacterized coiled-coil DUF342 family protein
VGISGAVANFRRLREPRQEVTPEERLNNIEIQIEKQNAGIQGLIAVGRACLDSIHGLRDAQKETTGQINELREAQAFTDERLNILIDTVDRIIRRDNNRAH